MSLTKTAGQAMQFEASGNVGKKVTGKSVVLKAANQLGTPTLLWLLVKRHKVALLALGNIVLVLNWALPEWPELVKSIIQP